MSLVKVWWNCNRGISCGGARLCWKVDVTWLQVGRSVVVSIEPNIAMCGGSCVQSVVGWRVSVEVALVVPFVAVAGFRS